MTIEDRLSAIETRLAAIEQSPSPRKLDIAPLAANLDTLLARTEATRQEDRPSPLAATETSLDERQDGERVRLPRGAVIHPTSQVVTPSPLAALEQRVAAIEERIRSDDAFFKELNQCLKIPDA